MYSNKLISLLLTAFAVVSLYSVTCKAKIDEPTKVVTVSEQLKDPASKAPDGYKYFTMAVDPNGFYNYIYYLPKAEQPALEVTPGMTKVMFDHKLTAPQKEAPAGSNYLYYYPLNNSFVYVFVSMPVSRFFGRLITLIGDHTMSIDAMLNKYRTWRTHPSIAPMLRAIEDMKKYYGITNELLALNKLADFTGSPHHPGLR